MKSCQQKKQKSQGQEIPNAPIKGDHRQSYTKVTTTSGMKVRDEPAYRKDLNWVAHTARFEGFVLRSLDNAGHTRSLGSVGCNTGCISDHRMAVCFGKHYLQVDNA